ncbi:MAG: hypothetical protein V4534_04845 [Myxococcota bacterium]
MNHVLFADAVSEIKSQLSLSIIRSSKLTYSKRRLRRILLPLMAVGLLGFSLLTLTFVHVGTWISGYAVASLENKQDGLLRELQALKLEEAVLKRPERIRKFAVEKLDLIPASKAPLLRP